MNCKEPSQVYMKRTLQFSCLIFALRNTQVVRRVIQVKELAYLALKDPSVLERVPVLDLCASEQNTLRSQKVAGFIIETPSGVT